MSNWILKLAAELLSEYSDRLSNDGCNDYTVPDYVPKDELQHILTKWNNGTKEDAKGLMGYNWAVIDAIAEEIKKEAINV